MVRRLLAHRAFQLTGGSSHTFTLGLGPRGRMLTGLRENPQANLLVAIPGGRVGRELRLK